ncbi:MAG: class I SAM-dependent methyltransferase [Nanoarchaeota archaeon]|nr:MAG: class I SAM-dependent methyltransferase [Nanoarchaeota archaeon]
MEKLESIKCPLCGSKDEKFLFSRDGFNVVQCRRCELVYINPRLKSNVLEELYNTNEISPEQYYEANIPQDTKNFKRRLKLISKYHPGIGKILDIGCNIGTLLKVAKDQGWDTAGVEFNKSAAAFGRKRFGVEIQDKDFMKIKFSPNSFDVVVMNDVIEHVTNPVETLNEVRRILKKGGLLFMSTPNIGALLPKMTKSKWLHMKPNEHLTYFTPKTIKVLLDKTGFKMKGWQSIGRVRSLETMLIKSQSYSKLPYAVSKVMPRKIRESISFYIDPRDEMAVFAVKESF